MEGLVLETSSQQMDLASFKPEENILSHFMNTEVIEALEALPAEFRIVVILADLEDFSYKEIAEIAGCPIGTVMSRLYRGRRMLRQMLYQFAVREGYIAPTETAEQSQATEENNIRDLSDYRLRRKDNTTKNRISG